MTIKLPVDVNTLDDETADALRKALDGRKQYVPFVGEIIEVWDFGCPESPGMRRFLEFEDVGGFHIVDKGNIRWNHYRRLDPTRILQFRDHEPGPCPCPDEEWVHVMWSDGKIGTYKQVEVCASWKNGSIIRWCPAVGVE